MMISCPLMLQSHRLVVVVVVVMVRLGHVVLVVVLLLLLVLLLCVPAARPPLGHAMGRGWGWCKQRMLGEASGWQMLSRLHPPGLVLVRV